MNISFFFTTSVALTIITVNFYLGGSTHAHQLNILKYPPNEKIALLKVNIELEYKLSRNNN
ncbi:hypothetical protein B2J90_06595 [Bacillus tropicus]|nr:hypothetical protein B2J90_06595 [Bacillus cereus]